MKVRTVYRCLECGAGTPKWMGRCPSCSAWNTLAEEVDVPRSVGRTRTAASASGRPVPIDSVDVSTADARPTGIGELDRVLGGGFVPGSVTLVGGEPGIGKSTLLLQVLTGVAARGGCALLVTAEESAAQVRRRAERLGVLHPGLVLLAETGLPAVLAAIDEVGPEIVVVDSIQTVADPDIESVPGSVAQVRHCATRLVREAKEGGTTVVLVGHVTKEGGLAGPRVLEHVVDTVVEFEGDRHHALRLLRAVKHRFGATGELGVFEMGDAGLAGVADPSGLFLGDRHPGLSGSVVVPAMEGHRPLLVEVQALVTNSGLSMPRRGANGLDGGRLALLLAVLGKWAHIPLDAQDVQVAVAGGVRVVEPAADLATVLALVSSIRERAVPADLVAVGEIGLGGELRSVAHLPRRLAEAARLGFTRAVVPASAPDPPPGIQVDRAHTVVEALALAGLRA